MGASPARVQSGQGGPGGLSQCFNSHPCQKPLGNHCCHGASSQTLELMKGAILPHGKKLMGDRKYLWEDKRVMEVSD